jgi:hypothetical protein
MHFNIYVNKPLGNALTLYASKQGMTRNRLIHEVLEQFMQQTQSLWPESILKFTGVPDFPAFEASRGELLAPHEDPLA